MEIVNLSAEPIGKLYGWLPRDLRATKIVFLPDACPGKSPLPTGTVVQTQQSDWRRFAVGDCGCGMRLLKSNVKTDALTKTIWNDTANSLRRRKGQLGDLGGGNHFLDALESYNSSNLHFLIHTGSRMESGLVDDLVDDPVKFDEEFQRIVDWAKSNRAAVHKQLEQFFGPLELILDLPHNTYEILGDDNVIIRKGAVRVNPGDLNVIPSNMAEDVVLVRATERVRESLCSLSHGTGRTMSRADCKPLADSFSFDELRKSILIPDSVQDASLRTDGPYAYRNLDDCLELLNGYVEEVERFSVTGYMGHL